MISFLKRPAFWFGALCLLGGLCGYSQPAAVQPTNDEPAAELASFQIADGFEANLFASEKDGVVKPIQIRFDTRGRIWVIGSTVYPQIEPGQIPNDKVLILEDTDGDGRCDKVTTFADGLMVPTGIELGDGGAYVGQGTELLFLKDNDGDGKADERRVVFRGFGTADSHQNINSFFFGPAGELWFSQGLHTRSRVETPWGISQLNQAGIWRMWPRRGKLEGFYGSENEPQNPWGFVFTDWNEPIVLAGNNSSPIYPVPGLVVNHRDEAPTLIWKNGNGRKTSGGDIVGNAHFPESWQGALILGGYINNAVWALNINDDGAGFMITDRPPLITSTSRSFRPVDAKFGPDGALYICDWYNPIIGHYQASFRHPDRDKVHGRIWRITAKGRPLTRNPNLPKQSIPQLLANLESPDRWTRRFSKRELADRPRAEVLSALLAFTGQSKLSDHTLMEALGVYQSHEMPAPELLARLARSGQPEARAYAAGAIQGWADRLPSALETLRPLARDENARVRLHAVVASTYVQSTEAIAVAMTAAELPTDKFIDYAVVEAVFALKPFWLPALTNGGLHLTATQIASLVRYDRSADVVDSVRELLRNSSTSPEMRELGYRVLAEFGNAEDIDEILAETDLKSRQVLLPLLVESARVRVTKPTDFEKLSALLASDDEEVRASGLRLVGIWKVARYEPVILENATNQAVPTLTRKAAVESLGYLGSASTRKALVQLLSDSNVAAEAIAALAGIDTPAAAMAFARSGASFGREQQTDILSALFRRPGGVGALLSAFSASPPPAAVAAQLLEIINSGGRREEALAAALRKFAGEASASNRMSADEIGKFSNEVVQSGNAQAGRAIFERAELGCIGCHSINGKGGTIGPNLSALGTAQPVDFIVGAILDPQKEIKEGYTSISVTTADGEEYQGYQVRETPAELVLRDPLLNREVRLARATIKQKKQNGSLMPNGLADGLTRAEFRDLVKYLSMTGRAN